MKNLIIGIAIIATTIAACNNGGNETVGSTERDAKTDTSMAISSEATPDTAASQSTTTNVAAFSANEIISGYLQLKNALAKDNGKDAAAAGNTMIATLAKVDMKSLSDVQTKSYMDIADDMKEHAEHIGANAGKIEHQREHFIMLSKDIADLVKTFGNGGQTLYKDFCPMANNGKGAIWISEVKEIKNPYLGGKMPGCGTVKETIK
ncbi:MAG: hypothetical protein JWP81_457 [Ferruginibacter sp.]|nr:hypothetical protein [Ferruginibacter sp.]